MINLLKTGILFFGISLLLWNCEQETVFEELQETPIAKVYKFEPQEIPSITSQIESRSRKNVFSRSSNKSEPYWIDNQNILGAIDTLGNKSFFYRLYFKNMPANTFYNIIVTERKEKDILPFVLAYEFENGKKKSMKFYGLEHFLNAIEKRENRLINNRYFARNNEYSNEPIDITDCGDLLAGNSGGVDSSNNNTGGGGTSTDPNGPTNSGNVNSYVSYGSYDVINYGGGSSGGHSGSVHVGEGTFTFPAYALRPSSQKDNARVICPEGEIIIVENTEEQIDDEGLTGKAECLNDHLDKKGDSFIKDILKKFEGNSKFDIKIVSKNKVFPTGVSTGSGLNGKTRYVKGSNLINIEISTSKLSNMPALAAARTLIHEYIHADMYRKINTTNYDGDLDFKTTYEKFKSGNFKATAQHETMAELYVNSMTNALKDFHKNVLTGDYNYLTNNGTNPLSNSFYEALAWQGLKDDNVKAYTDLSSLEKTALANALNAHYHSTTKNCPN